MTRGALDLGGGAQRARRRGQIRWALLALGVLVAVVLYFRLDPKRPLTPADVLAAETTVDPWVTERLAWERSKPGAWTEGLQVRDGRFFRDGKPYRGVGVNFYGLFLNLLRNPEDPAPLDYLRRLAEAGVPFVCFNAGGYWPGQWRRWLKSPQLWHEQMGRVVRTAEEAGIGLIPCMFWNLNLNKLVGERGDQWAVPGSLTHALMRRYTRELVGLYGRSEAIWAWEFSNEANLYVDLPNAKLMRQDDENEEDDETSEALVTTLNEWVRVIREQDPVRAILTGNSHPRFCAWNNTHRREWDPDTREQWESILLRDNPEAVETLGIHIYGDDEASDVCGAWSQDYAQFLAELRVVADEQQRPIFVGEFGLTGVDRSTEATKERFRHLLDAMQSAKVDLAAMWVVGHPKDPDWNVEFEGERTWMLDDVVEAHQAWQLEAPGQSSR